MSKSIRDQVADAWSELEAAVLEAEYERLEAIRAEVEAQIEADKANIDPLKIGEREYALNGQVAPRWRIIGAPRLGKERWVTVAPTFGGLVESFPEARFRSLFWEPGK